MKKRNYQHIFVKHIAEHSSIYIFSIVLFLMGVIFGAIIVNSLSFTQKEDLFYYLSQFFGQVSEGKVASSNDLFFQSLLHNSKFIALMWVLGLSIIGLPIILIILFMKGMVIGFTVGFLVNQMGLEGFFLSFGSVLPQNLLIIPVFIVMSCLAVTFSLRMIRRQFIKPFGKPIGVLFGRYTISLVSAVIVLVAAAGMEAYISPMLMKIIVQSVI